ncbi:negative regulator of systemic acquired resistance SNI1-like isoform X2 [Magnolia sinica]|uniref:negative regulator of systemic acquired resistance SNI1-like isoform X2 n=1 Tax=Magnolia sinica TaxID=86752 RepID=UPI0026591622|nr:negative regulator of systemic acquired resistance SNI1-like isoform X2 [Magnolia sinica]
MEESSRKRSRKSNRGYEENTMAIIDSSGVRDARDVEEDRLSFLEAVRSGSIVSENGSFPTRKMYEAIFQMLKDEKSLELMMESYQLLHQLDKRFPRVYSSHEDESGSSDCTSVELVVVEEAWSPFVVGLENAYSDKGAASRNSHDPVDSDRFFLLIHDLAQAVSEMDSKLPGRKALRDMLLFQYLVSVLEGDFLPRSTVYKETMNWALLRESLLHILLGSRNFKSLIKECIPIILKRSHHHVDISPHELKNEETVHDCDVALAISVMEQEKRTHISMHKFFTLIMELDVIKKEADSLGCTSRASGLRTPLLEVILGELTYDKDLLSPFLEGFSEPKWKLELVLGYFSKYYTKPSTRTRSSCDSPDGATFESFLKCFSNNTSSRSIIRKIGTEVVQILLAHSFQAYLSIQLGQKCISSSDQNTGSEALGKICSDMISAFQNLRQFDECTLLFLHLAMKNTRLCTIMLLKAGRMGLSTNKGSWRSCLLRKKRCLLQLQFSRQFHRIQVVSSRSLYPWPHGSFLGSHRHTTDCVVISVVVMC